MAKDKRSDQAPVKLQAIGYVCPICGQSIPYLDEFRKHVETCNKPVPNA